MVAIIPCAGYGTRVGMQKYEAKEMLPDGSKRIIDYSLDLCKKFKIIPLVITRPEKLEFNTYLKDLGIQTLEVSHSGEWAETVMKSKNLWHEDNILILPDTRFKPISIIQDIKLGLELGCNAMIGLHTVRDSENWGILKDYRLIEKPKNLKGPQYAWGVLGFKQYYGRELFIMDGSCPLRNAGYVFMDSFRDITR